MARIRSVHPGQWKDGDFLACSTLARLLCIALRNIADDRGAFRWKPLTIKVECLPVDNCEIDELLEELVENRQIERYECEGKAYGIIRDFCQWQKPKSPSAIYPVPLRIRERFGFKADSVDPIVETLPNNFPTVSEISPQTGEEEGGEEIESSLRSDLVDDARRIDPFDEFWKVYPRREGSNPKKPAKQAFRGAVRRGAKPAQIIAAARRLAEKHPDPTPYVPQAKTWLNQDRWNDQEATGPPNVVQFRSVEDILAAGSGNGRASEAV